MEKRDTKTEKMCSILAFCPDRLSSFSDPLESTLYGPSASNTSERF